MQNLILIFNHKYLDNQTGDRLVKVMGFLTDLKVYKLSLQHELPINPGFCFQNLTKELPNPCNVILTLLFLFLVSCDIEMTRKRPPLWTRCKWCQMVSCQSTAFPSILSFQCFVLMFCLGTLYCRHKGVTCKI